MSYEQAIRERHAFEDRLRNFLTLASVMTARELEIALSRLADMLVHMGDIPQVRLRGEVLRHYMELRANGVRRERAIKRLMYRRCAEMPPFDPRIDRSESDWYVRAMANFRLLEEGQIAPPTGAATSTLEETMLLLAP